MGGIRNVKVTLRVDERGINNVIANFNSYDVADWIFIELGNYMLYTKF